MSEDRIPSMDDKDTPSPPRRTTAQYEADVAKGINRIATNPK